jgi:hypothetical protein
MAMQYGAVMSQPFSVTLNSLIPFVTLSKHPPLLGNIGMSPERGGAGGTEDDEGDIVGEYVGEPVVL